ncbi:uncharacterized protein LOC110732585 isoform X2 [Chenopodium quinoa]|nr:uncharacterized protein LOC110732585 isoform X2 [Chenopodium quinoa]XP_021768234.1 uncharacterized protein LOC110732585 isoform X2 [Chenopodium quinoa]
MMLYYAYPSITDKEIKACRERNICEEKPIGILFYLALLLVTIGQCGHKNYMKSLKWEEKLEKLEKQKHEQKFKRKDGFNRRIIDRIHLSNSVKKIQFQLKKNWYEITGLLIALIVLPHVGASKHTQLLIRMCMLGISSCIFIVGKLSLFPFEGPRGSPILEVFHVILVAFKKRRYDISGTLKYFGNDISGDDYNSNNADCEPQDNNIGAYCDNDHNHSPADDETYGTRKDAEVSLDDHSRNYKPRKAVSDEVARDCSSLLKSESRKSEITDDLTARFGFFNKAALYNPSENPEAEVENGKLCTVKEVEDAKCFVRASLLSLTFLTYGLIQAVSSTFFVEQANNMDRHFRSLNLPVQIFKGFSTLGEYTVKRFCHSKRTKPHQRFHGAVRIGLGMLASCLCFIAAFLVEAKRLQALKDSKSLTAFYLLPQLILMGAMNALATSGIEDFFDHEMPDSVSISYGTIGQLYNRHWKAT